MALAYELLRFLTRLNAYGAEAMYQKIYYHSFFALNTEAQNIPVWLKYLN